MLESYVGQVVVVGLGGFVGSSARFALNGLVQRLSTFGTFPYGTLVVNVLGCLAIGFLGGLAEHRNVLEPGQRRFLLIGVLGGFTTFSAFAHESVGLAQTAGFSRAAINVAAQVIIGFGAAWIGSLGARHV